MEHIKLINSSGGVLNGSTMYDVTNYYEAVPSNALGRVLWLEADRMRALKVDDENLKNQRDVVKEEVRVNVLNQPYGGFPWLDMPSVAFRNWANAHNFYGDFADLDAASLADVQAFFKTYYLPNNAVLLILGDAKPEEGFSLAEKYFADIPRGPEPPFADPNEPTQSEERHGKVEEKFGTLPAIAIGYVLPKRRSPEWCAMALLDQALHGGRAGRIHRNLVLEKQIAVEAGGVLPAIPSAWATPVEATRTSTAEVAMKRTMLARIFPPRRWQNFGRNVRSAHRPSEVFTDYRATASLRASRKNTSRV